MNKNIMILQSRSLHARQASDASIALCSGSRTLVSTIRSLLYALPRVPRSSHEPQDMLASNPHSTLVLRQALSEWNQGRTSCLSIRAPFDPFAGPCQILHRALLLHQPLSLP